MSFRDEIESARAKLAELEQALDERDARIAELKEKLEGTAIGERQRIQIRRLETAIAAARREAEDARAAVRLASRPARPGQPPSSSEDRDPGEPRD